MGGGSRFKVVRGYVSVRQRLAAVGGDNAVRVLRWRSRPRFYLTYLGNEETPEAASSRDAELRGTFSQHGVHLEYGWLPEPPSEGQRGGGGGGGVEAVLDMGIRLGAGAAGLLLAGFVGAMGADGWAAIKRPVILLRERLPQRSDALRIRLVVQLRTGQRLWVTLPVDRLREALAALDYLQLPPVPWGPFNWQLEWDPQKGKWILPLETTPAPESESVPVSGIKDELPGG